MTSNYLLSFRNSLKEINKVMNEGESLHGKNNWINGSRSFLINKHLLHAFNHIKNASDLDIYEDNNIYEEISHAATRSLMALEVLLSYRNNNNAS